MQNSEAIKAWIQGKMATFRILVLVSKTEIRSREFSFSSRSLRMKIINLDLVSMPEIGGDFFSVSSRSLRLSVRNSRSRLDVRDWIRETLILVSRMKKWLSLTSVLKSKCQIDFPLAQYAEAVPTNKAPKFQGHFSEERRSHSRAKKTRQSELFLFRLIWDSAKEKAWNFSHERRRALWSRGV